MRCLGIDVGRRRIGLAVSDATYTLARPLITVTVRGDGVGQIADIVRTLAAEEDGLAQIVVGWPRRLDGSESDQAVTVKAFSERLRERTGLPIAFVDERLSSVEAESRLALREKDWRRRKARLDAAAAAVILQDYLDGLHTSGEGAPEEALRR
jgi:putative Holliday junction resolvase